MNRLKIILFSAAGLIVLFLVFLPDIIEYFLEKNDVEWIGREVAVDDIDLNLFTGRLQVDNAVMYERDGTTPFVSIENVDVNMRMLSLLSSTYEFEYIHLTRPVARMVQTGLTYNYDDFKPEKGVEEVEEEPETEEPSDPVKYILNDIQLINGSFNYQDDVLKSEIDLDGIDIIVPRLAYDTAAIDVILKGKQVTGGILDLKGRVDWGNSMYDVAGTFEDWQLRPYKNYLDDYLSILDFSGSLNIDANFHGDYSDSSYMATKASAFVSDFLLVDANQDSVLRWKKFELGVDSVHTGEHIYDLGGIILTEPDILVKYFREGDNFTGMYTDTLGTQTLDTLQVSDEGEIVFQNPFQYLTETLNSMIAEDFRDTYGADTMAIVGGHLLFQDFSHLEEADIVMEEMLIAIDPVSSDDSTIHMLIDSRINTTGTLAGDLTLYREGEDMEINLLLEDFYFTTFDPYSRFYTAYPIWEGKMKISSNTTVYNNVLTSENKLFIEQPIIGNKINYDAEYKVPVKLAVGLLKDVDGNIDLEMPIEGNLDDPDYKIGKVILDVVVNLFVKAAASPYKLLARTFNASEDDLRMIQFLHNQDSLDKAQIKAMDLTARVLEQKEDLSVNLRYVMNEKEEKEIIAITRARQDYFENAAPDSIQDMKDISEKDSLFVMYLDNKVGGLGTRTIAEMSMELVGEETVQQRVNELREAHLALVSQYLFEDKKVSETRLSIFENDSDSLTRIYPRPVFLIEYDASESAYPQADSVAGPRPAELPSPEEPASGG